MDNVNLTGENDIFVYVVNSNNTFAIVFVYIKNDKIQTIYEITKNLEDANASLCEIVMGYYALREVDVVLNDPHNDFSKILKDKEPKINITLLTNSNYLVNGLTTWKEKWVDTDFKKVKNAEVWKDIYALEANILKLPFVESIEYIKETNNTNIYLRHAQDLAKNI